jgi:cell division septation protein DedD
VINMLCGRALEGGHREGARAVSAEILRTAARQIGLEPPRRRASDRRRASTRRWIGRVAATAAAGAAVLAGAYQAARYYDVQLWQPGATRSLSAGVPSPQAPAPPPAAPVPNPQPATPLPPPDDAPGGSPPPAAAQPPAPVVVYSILAGSFANRADADRGADALRTAGYLVRDIVQTEGAAEFRVLVGRYTDLALARLHADRLAQDPYFREATIVTEK